MRVPEPHVGDTEVRPHAHTSPRSRQSTASFFTSESETLSQETLNLLRRTLGVGWGTPTAPRVLSRQAAPRRSMRTCFFHNSPGPSALCWLEKPCDLRPSRTAAGSCLQPRVPCPLPEATFTVRKPPEFSLQLPSQLHHEGTSRASSPLTFQFHIRTQIN